MINGKILVVDDEEGMRVTLKKILSNRGYAVITAADFEEAQYYLHNEEFDTIVTDIFLYDINGLELLRLIKEHFPDVPTIIITGEPNVDTAIESIRLGAYDYLIKPITKNNLPPIIAKAVEKKKLIEEKRRLEEENQLIRLTLEKEIKQKHQEGWEADLNLKKYYQDLFPCTQIAGLEVLSIYLKQRLNHPLKEIHHSLLWLKNLLKHHDHQKAEIHLRAIEEKIQVIPQVIDTILNSMNKCLGSQKTDLILVLEKTLELIHIPDYIKINKETLTPLPPFIVNEFQIQHVFINILSNAFQAIKEKGTVSLASWPKNHHVEIQIKDTGLGIPLKDQERIFEPFFTTHQHRAGLGLTISKIIIEKYGGSLSVVSKEGEGTAFTISLPLVDSNP